MTIHVTNNTYESVSTADYGDIDQAYEAAVKAGLEIASNEVAMGIAASIVHIVVDMVDGEETRRGCVAVSTARLREG